MKNADSNEILPPPTVNWQLLERWIMSPESAAYGRREQE
jgi:hypothetical protein